MVQVLKKNSYKAFGLRIISDFVLPELSSINIPFDCSDIVIENRDLSIEWSNSAEQGKMFYIRENFVLFKINDTAIFSIQNGNNIAVSSVPGSDENKIRLYILGTCMGALLMQRKILPLHGSAIEINGKVYAIVGERGAGKSTLASALISKGFKFLSDDVISVSLNLNGNPIVTPSYPQQKLWEESLTVLGKEATQFNPLFERETKYAVPVTEHFLATPLELAGVFELTKSDSGNVMISIVEGLERFPLLYTHTFRNFLIPKLGLREWHFNYTSRLVNKIKIYKLQRPESMFTAHKLADVILKTIREKELNND